MNVGLTAEHEEKVNQLEEELRAGHIPLAYYHPDEHNDAFRKTLLVKFLTARNWSVPCAVEMINGTIKFRAENGLEDLPLYPPPSDLIRGYNLEDLSANSSRKKRTTEDLDRFFGILRHCYVGVYHKWDRGNRPIWIERTGKMKPKKLHETLKRMAKPGESHFTPAVNFHMYTNELWGELTDYQRRNLNDPNICQSTAILDCDGFSLSMLYKPILELMKVVTTMDQRYYPEAIHKIFVVNTPRSITIPLSVIKPWLNTRIQQKIVVLRPHELDKLHEEIDPINLPSFLGGQCSCEGGCVPECQESGTGEDLLDGNCTEKIEIPAGQKAMREMHITSGCIAEWEFTTDGNRSVAYGVTLGTDALVPMQKLDAPNVVRGSYGPADVAGVLNLCFDNSFSWISGKTVYLLTTVLSPTDIAEVAADSNLNASPVSEDFLTKPETETETAFREE